MDQAQFEGLLPSRVPLTQYPPSSGACLARDRTPSSSSTNRTVSLPWASSNPDGRGGCGHRLGGGRQEQVENGPAARLAFDCHVPAAGLEDAVDHGQPEPSPVGDRLGRLERLEDPGPGGRVHPDPGVRHRQPDLQPRPQAVLPAHLGLSQGLPGGHGQALALGHGVAGVHDQVHEHLFHLAGVHPDQAGFGP